MDDGLAVGPSGLGGRLTVRAADVFIHLNGAVVNPKKVG